MQLKRGVTASSLATLNDDCLLLISAKLAINDQFALLQLNARFQALILRIWRGKYASEFDCSRQRQLKLLSNAEQDELLRHIGSLTSALLNLNARGCQTLWRKRKCSSMPRLRKLSINLADNAAEMPMPLPPLLSQLPTICMNIAELRLQGGGQLVTPAALRLLFAQLHLSAFELLPSSDTTASKSEAAPADADAPGWSAVKYCKTLRTLQLPARAVRLTAAEIAELPQLQQLTLHCCPAADIDDDMANGASAAVAWLTALLAQGGDDDSDGVACQIVALHLQCQLDKRLPQLLLTHAAQLCRLHALAWHAQLTVHYDATDGSIKWRPQQPQVARAVLQLIASQAESLRELDFTRNVHATPTFLASFDVYHQVAVWYDGCPKAKPATAITSDSDSDLSFMRFTLRQL